ncbi:MAG: pyridoxamine 5'-phosphate oxidase [Candidatus Dormibacteria bacterium]
MLERDLDPDPLAQFRRWFAEALEEVSLGEAAALATSTRQGRPSLRMVLVKSFDERGFVFHSNYRSRKGLELARNPEAALLFHWKELGRQIRIEGSTERITAAESDAYFAGRPRRSQLGAVVSAQSQPLPSKEELDRRVEELQRSLGEVPVLRPDWWGGYRLAPRTYEFWQHREDRLHERWSYVRQGDGWARSRLQP